MLTSEAKRRANAKYRKNNVKTHTLAFYPDDKELYEWLCEQPNRSAYLRELVRQDMLKHKQNEQQ